MLLQFQPKDKSDLHETKLKVAYESVKGPETVHEGIESPQTAVTSAVPVGVPVGIFFKITRCNTALSVTLVDEQVDNDGAAESKGEDPKSKYERALQDLAAVTKELNSSKAEVNRMQQQLV